MSCKIQLAYKLNDRNDYFKATDTNASINKLDQSINNFINLSENY